MSVEIQLVDPSRRLEGTKAKSTQRSLVRHDSAGWSRA